MKGFVVVHGEAAGPGLRDSISHSIETALGVGDKVYILPQFDGPSPVPRLNPSEPNYLDEFLRMDGVVRVPSNTVYQNRKAQIQPLEGRTYDGFPWIPQFLQVKKALIEDGMEGVDVIGPEAPCTSTLDTMLRTSLDHTNPEYQDAAEYLGMSPEDIEQTFDRTIPSSILRAA